MRRVVAIVALVLAAVAACGQQRAPTGQPVVVERGDTGFALSMRVGTDVVDAGAPIDISAVLTWEGPAATATIWGSGGGPVAFGLQQIDGGTLTLGPAMTADCMPHDFVRLVPVAIPFRKSGGYSADDPQAGFYKAFFADPVLRLPAGTWRVVALVDGFLKPCDANAPGIDITLEAEILVR